jgi:MFS family permease
MLKTRGLVGISVFWLALSMLTDGRNSLILPAALLGVAPASGQATALGLLSFAGLLPAALIQPAAGAWSDRLRPRWGRRGFLAPGLVLILIGLLVFGAGSTLPWVAAGYLVALIASSIAQAGQQGFIPDLAPPAQRGQAAGWKSLMDLAGAMLGFVLLGQLLGSGQVGLALAVMGVVLLLTFALTLALVREPRQPGVSGESIARVNLASMYRLDWRAHGAFVRVVAARFFFLLGTYAVGRFLLFFVAERLGLNAADAASQAGGLLAGLSLVTVIFALPAGWAADRFGRVPLMALGAVVSAAGILLLIGANSTAAILVGGGLMALGSAAFSSANWALAVDLAPPDQAARFLGFANFGTAGAAAAAGLFGPVMDLSNRLWSGSGYSALFVLAALATLTSLLALRGLRARAAQAGSVTL